MKTKFAVAVVAVMVALSGSAYAQGSFTIEPFTYDPGSLCDEQASWVSGAGIGGGSAILLQKNCTTATEAAAGIEITSSLEGGDISALTELNLIVKGHCGAGAPRFNVVVDGSYYFLGCSSGEATDAGNGYTRVVFDTADFTAAGIPATGTLEDIYVIFDEGTDTPTSDTIVTPGEAYIAGVSVNGVEISEPSGPMTKDQCKNGGWMTFTNPTFKNQGQCVSYVVSHRGGNGGGNSGGGATTGGSNGQGSQNVHTGRKKGGRS